ncbi:RNA-binding protein 43 [Pagrus major]|uniref:RNA-binding protein 43 n=1 Tax=Pagrus major TaxID=143350 RepID=UPI003CC8DA63
MDFPVEATVLLNNFPDETQVRKILRSHGFELRDLSRDEVSVKGSFLNLKAAKASLELLLKSQTKPDIAPPSPSPVPTASSGAISKYYTSNSSDRNRSRPGSRKQASPTTITTNTTTTTTSFSSSNHHPTSYSPRPDQQRGSLRSGKESFVVDADVFGYAERLRKKDIDCILESHNVEIESRPVGESCSVTLHGKSARTAVFKLQSLLHDLNKSLRTQEVSLRDMDRDGRAMLVTIQEDRNIWKSVLVCQKKDGLHLIGPSGESYELKQRLLGRPVDRSGQRGRTLDRNSRGRSSSLPPINRRNTERESAAVAYPSPAGAAGYTPSKYQYGKREGAESKQGAAAALKRVFRGRSFSETRHKNTADRTNGNVQEMENKSPTLKSPKKGAKQFLIAISPDNIKTAFKNRKKWR